MSTSDNITIQQAIDAMENIRDYWTTRPTERAAAQMAIDALREKQNPNSPKPLTLNEIKNIEDRHIYVQMIHNGRPTNTVVYRHWNKQNPIFKLKNYNITWRAFNTMPPLTEKF